MKYTKSIQRRIEQALEEIDIDTGLKEIGFRRPESNDSGKWLRTYRLEYRNENITMNLYSIGNDDDFTRITISYNRSDTKNEIEREYYLPGRLQRGYLQASILEIYKECFPKSIYPEGLLIGYIYTQHIKDLNDFVLKPIHIWVNYRDLVSAARAIEKDLGLSSLDIEYLEKYSKKVIIVSIEHDNLIFLVGGRKYYCRSQGLWNSNLTIPLLEFLSIPSHRYEYEDICMTMRKGRVQIGSLKVIRYENTSPRLRE